MSGSYLLDTSVYSQPLRRKPVNAALQRWSAAEDVRCRVSVVSVAEVEWGLHLENHPVRWEKYRHLLENRVQVLPTGEEIWHRFAQMKASQQKSGHPIADFDLLIAATASVHQLVVATLNHNDFSRIEGVGWENWATV